MDLHQLKIELEKELNENILWYWMEKVYDPAGKTFYGRLNLDETPDPAANKSAVLITRILWAFSAAYRLYPKPEYKQMADEAYRLVTHYFWDVENGGLFWEITGGHQPSDTKKQFYALAFGIYACSEYYLAFDNEQARQLAVSLYMIIEAKSFNPANNGYIDVLSGDWKKISGLRLSEKEIADTMTMNTHLHILEAYTNLYRIWPDDELRLKLKNLLRLFLDKIVNRETGHFSLFFDEQWNKVGDVDSYGHDIEGTWLMYEAAELLGNPELLKEVQDIAIQMGDVVIAEAIAPGHGGLWYEKENGHLCLEFHWWPQAEAVVGFFNLWQITSDEKYLAQAFKSWDFIKNHIVDSEKGEWFWSLDANLRPHPIEKVNGWKCPYHNGRMCLEIINRINKNR